jgi:FtsH-binding integral membrane protein
MILPEKKTMSQFPNNSGFSRPGSMLGYESNVDSITQSRFFNAVYSWMAAGLALTAVVAWAVADSPTLRAMALSLPVLLVAFVVEIGLVMTISGAINRISASTATVLFMLYSAINGFTLSILVLLYKGPSLAATFVVTAGTFGAMSLYGYITKRDLTRIGSLLFMALIGVILASVVNMFFASSLLYWGITYAGVLIFVGLTAYDTQQLRMIAAQTSGNPALASRLAVTGSLRLYLDFINLFLLLLRLMGNRRN